MSSFAWFAFVSFSGDNSNFLDCFVNMPTYVSACLCTTGNDTNRTRLKSFLSLNHILLIFITDFYLWLLRVSWRRNLLLGFLLPRSLLNHMVASKTKKSVSPLIFPKKISIHMKYEHDFQNWRGWAKRFLSNLWVLNNHSSHGKAGFISPHKFVEEIPGSPPSATPLLPAQLRCESPMSLNSPVASWSHQGMTLMQLLRQSSPRAKDAFSCWNISSLV